MAQAKPDPTRFKAFAGIRNTVSPERFGPGDLELAVNADIDDTGRISRRKGYPLRMASTGAHSLYSDGDLAVFVQSTSLKRIAPDYTATTLRTVTASRRMSYRTVVGRTFYSNGLELGIIEQGVSRSWGITPPEDVGQAAGASGGYLPAGKYQWTLTFLRGDGQESGALITHPLILTADSRILFSDLPVSGDAGVVAKLIYLTKTNGDIFYEALTLDNADTTAIYSNNGVELTREIETLHMQPPPAGQFVGYFRGQMLMAVGAVLFHSLPYNYELFDLREFFDFESAIALVATVEDGIFVCTGTHHYWLPGVSPKDWSQQVKTDVGAIPGTLTYVDGKIVGEGIGGIVALWLSRSGLCLGANGGVFKILSADRVNANISRSEGASVVIDSRVISTAEV